MKKTKILSAICAAAVLTTMVASCGSSNSGSSDSGSKQLIYWTVGGATGDNKAGIDAANKYLKEKLGFELKVNIADWGDYDSKINTILNSGEYFDLMFTNNTNYSTAVTLGAFEDITNLVSEAAPGLQEVIPQDLWDAVKINDKVYAVPTYKDSSMTQYWYIDKKYLDKYNIDMSTIKTFEDLDKAFRTIKEGEGDNVYPFMTNQGSLFNGFFNNYDGLCAGFQPIGVRYDDETRTVVNVFEQEDIVKNLEIMHNWFNDGITNPDAPTSTETYKQQIFGTGQGFPGAEVSWAANQGVDEYVTSQVFGPLYTTETIQGSMNAIGVTSKYKNEALQYLELANTDSKFRDILAYGAEGTDFEYVSDGVVKKLNDNYSWPSYTQASFFNLSTVEGSPKDQWDQVKKLNESAEKSTVLGFALDQEPIKNELTACKTVYDKYKYELLTGASNPTEMIPKMNKELKAAGLDTIIQEAQKQIDEFFADK